MRIPTIQELQTAITSSFESQFGTLNRGLRATHRTLAQVLSGQLRLLYLYAGRIQRNLFPDQADIESQGGTLERWGRARLGRNPFPASAGIYTASVTGQIGGVIRNGLTYRAPNGFIYIVESSLTLTATTGVITLRSLTAGLDAQLTVNDVLEATEPILNVDQQATITAETTAPLNAESVEAYRNLIIQSFRTESQGGASGDYRIWSADAQGVRRVYPFVPTPGNINLYVEANADDSTDNNGTPSQTILDNVQSVVELDPDTNKNLNERGRLPLGVFQIQYLAVTPIQINITINGYTGNISNDTTAIRNAISELMLEVRPFVAGADASNQSILYANRLINVILQAVGLENNLDDVQMTEGTNPAVINTRQFTNGDIPYLGTLTINA